MSTQKECLNRKIPRFEALASLLHKAITLKVMKTRNILSSVVLAAAALSTTSCVPTHYPVASTGSSFPVAAATAVYAAPASVSCKRIVLDFNAAQTRCRDDSMPDGKWNAWTKCDPVTITTRPFTSNNKCLNGKCENEIAYWSYKKTGAKTAELDNGIGGESSLGFPRTYYLTFETESTGTATASESGEGECSETINIRFSIK